MNSLSADLSYVTSVAGRSAILTREEESELARRFRDSGDRRAADTLVRAQLRMVIVVALKHRHYGIAVSELVAEGNCGLVVALSKFDPERAIRFGTYAKHWVRANILACVIRCLNIVGNTTGPVRPQLFFRLRRERARITALLGEGTAADEALALRMSVSVERLRCLLGSLDARHVSLDAPSSGERNDPLVDTLTSSDNPEEHYFDGRRNDVATSAVAAALMTLDPRERFIIERRIMAPSTEELSLAEIAETLSISRERVRQLEERAKYKLGRSPAIQRNSQLREWFAE